MGSSKVIVICQTMRVFELRQAWWYLYYFEFPFVCMEESMENNINLFCNYCECEIQKLELFLGVYVENEY